MPNPILCKTCEQPMRYLGTQGVMNGRGLIEVVGIECPNEDCRSHKVVTSDVWMASLQELNTGWPDNVFFGGVK